MTTTEDVRLREILAVTSDAAVTVHDLAYLADRYHSLLAAVPVLERDAVVAELRRLAALPGLLGFPLLGTYAAGVLSARARLLARREEGL